MSVRDHGESYDDTYLVDQVAGPLPYRNRM